MLFLVQDGKSTLDEKAAKYLHGAHESRNAITIRQLLSPTSGLVRDPADYHPYVKQPVADVIEEISPLALSFAPGEKWLYSNVVTTSWRKF